MKQQERLDLILAILRREQISNQHELRERLKAEGCEVTQSTLSRDFAQLGIVKQPSPTTGKTIYVCEADRADDRLNERAYEDIARGLKSCAFSGNLAILKTYPGQGQSVAAAIDFLDLSILLGTVAGDDTIIAVLAEDATREELRTALKI